MNPPSSVQKAINAQIKNELQAHYNYLGMSAYFQRTAYLGFAKWMRAQSAEEYGHAMKLYDYLRSETLPLSWRLSMRPGPLMIQVRCRSLRLPLLRNKE